MFEFFRALRILLLIIVQVYLQGFFPSNLLKLSLLFCLLKKNAVALLTHLRFDNLSSLSSIVLKYFYLIISSTLCSIY